MASVASTVRSIKQNPSLHVDPAQILAACQLAGHAWRDRVFNPVVTVQLFMLQVLHGNVSCRRLMRIAGMSVKSERAYGIARARLPLDVMGYLAAEVTQSAKQTCDSAARWLGHRVLMIDGSGISMPDTPALRQAFGVPGRVTPGCGFPVMHTLWMMDMATGMIRDFVTGRWNIHDMRDACRLHGNLEEGDVVVGDRAFGLFAFLSTLNANGLFGVCRANQKLIVSFRVNRRSSGQVPKAMRKGRPRSEYVRRLGRTDQVVRYLKPKKQPAGLSAEAFAALPDTLLVREVRVTVRGRDGRRTKIVLLTTRSDRGRSSISH